MMVNWGSVPDWLAGAGAVFALLFASLAVRASYRTNHQQAKQLEQQAEQLRQQTKQFADLETSRRREQAERVSAWIEEVPIKPTGLASATNEDRIAVRNSSEQPIFNVYIYCYGDIPDGYLDSVFHEIIHVYVIPPTTTPTQLQLRAPFPKKQRHPKIIGLLFTDAADNTWERRPELGEVLTERAYQDAVSRRSFLSDCQQSLDEGEIPIEEWPWPGGPEMQYYHYLKSLETQD